MVFKREVEGNITKVPDAKIAVFSCPLDSMATETKVEIVHVEAPKTSAIMLKI
jgi:hypothetical protein